MNLFYCLRVREYKDGQIRASSRLPESIPENYNIPLQAEGIPTNHSKIKVENID